jgi:glycosyltransferase involved in cell wall biosynthesis
MQVLWLPAWYPNKTEPFAGDFIQRHAKSVALYHAVQVIHIVRDKDGIITKNIKEENYQLGQLTEKIIYYHTPVFPVAVIDKLISTRFYGRLYRKYIKTYLNKNGMPAIAHVHIAGKNGLVALWLKRKYKIPFVVSEHWSVYLPEAVPRFDNFSRLFKLMWNRIMNGSKGLSTVSNHLGTAIRRLRKNIEFTVIPNVVDDTIFFPVEKAAKNTVQFIHISSLNFPKNPEAILQAFSIVKKVDPGFTLSVFGPQNDDLKELVVGLGLQDHVLFQQEVPQPQLAVSMQQADALILYSRFETFGCVLIEAGACGIPVIVSDIPAFHETVQEGLNGYFAGSGKPELLAQKIIWFMQQDKKLYDKKIIAATAEKYHYNRVGKLFSEFYKTALEN